MPRNDKAFRPLSATVPPFYLGRGEDPEGRFCHSQSAADPGLNRAVQDHRVANGADLFFTSLRPPFLLSDDFTVPS